MERAQVAPIEPEDVTRPKWDIFEKCAHLEAENAQLRAALEPFAHYGWCEIPDAWPWDRALVVLEAEKKEEQAYLQPEDFRHARNVLTK